jgi:hypothetical protein
MRLLRFEMFSPSLSAANLLDDVFKEALRLGEDKLRLSARGRSLIRQRTGSIAPLTRPRSVHGGGWRSARGLNLAIFAPAQDA